ncbi:MAG: hypothetical protein QXL96_08145 [Ignisphaera sp.]
MFKHISLCTYPYCSKSSLSLIYSVPNLYVGAETISRTRVAPRKINVDAVKDPKLLVDEVSKLLYMDEREARGFIGGTTITAYRRVHEIIASVLDRTIALRGADVNTFQKMVHELLVELSKALVLVKYQRARGQLSDGLATNLESLIDITTRILKDLPTKPSSTQDHSSIVENVVNTLTRARTLLDALATLVYTYGR